MLTSLTRHTALHFEKAVNRQQSSLGLCRWRIPQGPAHHAAQAQVAAIRTGGDATRGPPQRSCHAAVPAHGASPPGVPPQWRPPYFPSGEVAASSMPLRLHV